MNESKPSFAARLSLAWQTLMDADFAAHVTRLRRGDLPTSVGTPRPDAKPVPQPIKAIRPDGALQLLGLLQQEGRFVDFLQEDVSSHSDADIGGAARIVHDGCRKVLNEHFTIAPVRDDAEGARLTLQDGFDASEIRLTGNVVGKPPFTGTLAHRGWRATDVRLPTMAAGHDAGVLAPAEVEL